MCVEDSVPSASSFRPGIEAVPWPYIPSYYHTAILDKAKVSPEFNTPCLSNYASELERRTAKLVEIAVLATIDRLLVTLPMGNRRYWGLGFVTCQGGDLWGIHTGCSIDHLLPLGASYSADAPLPIGF